MQDMSNKRYASATTAAIASQGAGQAALNASETPTPF